MSKAAELLRLAREEATRSTSWASLSNFLFSTNGLVTLAYPTRQQREIFATTPEYRAIRGLVNEAIRRHGLVEGATP